MVDQVLPEGGMQVRFAPSYGPRSVIQDVLVHRVFTGLRYTEVRSFPGLLPIDEIVPEGFIVERRHGGIPREALLASCAMGLAVMVELVGWNTVVSVAAPTRELLRQCMEVVAERARELGEASSEILTRMWFDDGGAPTARMKSVPAAHWIDIRANYPRGVRGQLDQLMALMELGHGGRLILWYGAPGTGKTNAVLALMRAWQAWTEPHLVTDPESFFSKPQYLMDVLGNATAPSSVDPLWRLIIAEDADEFLRADARARSGPALGRLLNATDGILSRGQRSIFLLTTNDPITRLHPAVVRPGRCLARVAFTAFSAEEARGWLGEAAAAPTDAATLAELYELRERRFGIGLKPESLSTGVYL